MYHMFLVYYITIVGSRCSDKLCTRFITVASPKADTDTTKASLLQKIIHTDLFGHQINMLTTKSIPEGIVTDRIRQIMSLSPRETSKPRLTLTLLTPPPQSLASIWVIHMHVHTCKCSAETIIYVIFHTKARKRWFRGRSTGVEAR